LLAGQLGRWGSRDVVLYRFPLSRSFPLALCATVGVFSLPLILFPPPPLEVIKVPLAAFRQGLFGGVFDHLLNELHRQVGAGKYLQLARKAGLNRSLVWIFHRFPYATPEIVIAADRAGYPACRPAKARRLNTIVPTFRNRLQLFLRLAPNPCAPDAVENGGMSGFALTPPGGRTMISKMFFFLPPSSHRAALWVSTNCPELSPLFGVRPMNVMVGLVTLKSLNPKLASDVGLVFVVPGLGGKGRMRARIFLIHAP
jgi:hypothetical protein